MDIRAPSEEERDLGACSHREFLRVESSARRASLPGDTDRVGDGGDCSSRHEALLPSPHPTPPLQPPAFPEERQPPVRARDPTASAPTTKRGSTSHEPKRVECCTIFFFYQMGGCSRGCKVTLRRRRRASAVCCTLAALSRPQGIPRCPRKSWLCSSTPRGANLKTERSAALPPAVVIHCYVRRASYDTGRSQGSVRARLKRSA